MDYLNANDVSPLFCALLLRLGDLLDFDDTRAPKVLYSYVERNEKSSEEWKKHQASAGFSYPTSPTTEALPYKARCTNPRVEHAVRNFWTGLMMNWEIVQNYRSIVIIVGNRISHFQDISYAMKSNPMDI